jgi:hypothetical protein
MADNPDSAVTLGGCQTLDLPTTEISLDKILRVQGYRDLSAVRADVREIATIMTTKAATLVAPTARYRRVCVDSCNGDTLKLATGISLKSEIFTHVLRNCEHVLPFVLTLGEEIDHEVSEHLKKDEIVQGLFLETAGWLSIEQASRQLALHLQRQIKKDGLGLTRRLGPGYNEWDLIGQKPLFELFSDTALPVQLLESCVMFPKKSRSGLYGLRPLSSPRTGTVPL